MAVSTPALHEAITGIVGREHLAVDPRACEAAAVDGVPPGVVARPGTAEEVSGLLALATAERLAVAPRGSGSSQALGAAPRRLDLVLDLTRLDAVTEYVPADMVASVEAGMTLGALDAHLRPQQQRLALDPPGADRRTIGGVLATGASGTLRFRYGTGRDLLLGVRFALADGTLTWGGAKVVKSATGYDVPKLFVGSLGTLGVVVGATLRLHPRPAAEGGWIAAFRESAPARAFLADMLASSIEPERVALVNDRAARASGLGGSARSFYVSIASDLEAVESQGAALADLTRRAGGEVAPLDASTWRALDDAFDAPVRLVARGEVRRVLSWLDRVETLGTGAGIGVSAVGQAGNGVLHLALDGVDTADRLERILGPLRQEMAGEGGSVVVERAPLDIKRAIDVWGPVGADALGIMRRLKREFDPHGVLNPGRFVGGL
jgi:glycolate oxidase FAD binding subunit